jgi:1-acyl-sn-glycerol-3-phosphate acyltransferase
MILKGITVLSALLAVLSGVFGSIWMLPVYFVGYFLEFLVLAVVILLVAALVVDMEKPQEKADPIYRFLVRHYIDLAVTLGRVRIEKKGLEKLPKDGRFLLVCNHINDLDPGILLHCCPESQLLFIAKRETKDMFLVGPLLYKLNCQLINRENDKEALRTILKCIQIIKDDQASVGVFPEGYVSLDGKLRHFRSGVLKIAQKSGVPIVVCTVQGTKEVLPNLKKLRPSLVKMHLVDVIDAQTVQAMTTVDLGEMIYEKMISDMGESFRSDEKAMHPDLQKARMEQ